jgi:hypothetical protein
MAKIKLLGVKTIKAIKRRLLAGETSVSIAKDYPVTAAHIRKIRLGLKNPNHPNARWGYITLEDENETLEEMQERHKKRVKEIFEKYNKLKEKGDDDK